jgi:tetratricopeptide (TPR) repeat protein
MKKGTLVTTVIILLSTHACFAIIDFSKLSRDSLRVIINDRSLPDTTRIRNGIYLTQTYDYVDPDSMLYYSRIYHEASLKANYPFGISYTKVFEGWYYTMTGHRKEAMKCYLSAKGPAEETGMPAQIAFVYGEVATGYGAIEMLDKACDYHLRAIRIYRKLKNIQLELSQMHNLAQIYIKSGNVKKSIETRERIIFIIDSLKLPSLNLKAAALDALGSAYKRTGRRNDAVIAYDHALRLHIQNGNLWFQRITLINLSTFFLDDTLNLYGKVIGDKRKSADIALAFLRQADTLARKMHDTTALARCYNLTAKAFSLKGENKKALEYVLLARKLKSDETDLQSGIENSEVLTEIYTSLGDFKKAAGQYKLMKTMLDSLEREKMAEKVSLLTESFEIEQMEAQLNHKEQQLKQNRYITYLFITISVLVLILALIIFYFLRQKQKAAKLLEHQNHEIEKARNRAEKSERFKEDFLASMSHEIRTPLNAVIGMTGLLLDEKHSPGTENYLRNIKQAGEHLTGIINDILDLSKIEAGKLELHIAPFSLRKLLEEMEHLFGVRAREKELQLIIHEGDDVPDWVSGDSGRIRQVLVNLAGNAIKFTDRGSVQIRITSSGLQENRAFIQFSVEDTGPGIQRRGPGNHFR